MAQNNLIFCLICGLTIYFILNPKKYYKIINIIKDKFTQQTISPNQNKIENWRDLAFKNQNTITYNKLNDLNLSRNNLPVYYPISSPLEDNYFNYLNSISSPKLSMVRSLLLKVLSHSNQDSEPIIFNNADRPISIKKINLEQIKVLAKTIIDSINKFADNYLMVESIQTQNEIHEETDTQSRINFDIKIKLFYNDLNSKFDKTKYDIIYIQSEFIFEKIYPALPEDQFFKADITVGFRAFLSKLIIIGANNNGMLAGNYYSKNK
jgi:hypothetical protein